MAEAMVGRKTIGTMLAVAAVGFLLSFATVDQAHAANDSIKTTRAIAIAYDNSGSMIADEGGASDKWCKAKYSLEVLAAMLDKEDTLSVFVMDEPGCKLSVSGSEDVSRRAAIVHDTDLGYASITNTQTAKEARDSLLSSSADEKYLVITTDGAFNSEGTAERSLAAVQGVVDECPGQDITVIYLAIGEDAAVIQGNESVGVYVRTTSADGILSAMTEVANQVFGRAALPSSAYSEADGTVSVDVPMGNLIVFAQGKNVSVGSLKNGDGEFASESAEVRYSDNPGSLGGSSFLVDESLQGIVAVFDEDIREGTYDLGIGGCETLEIYYKPYIDIASQLTDDAGNEYLLEAGNQNEVPAGTYEVDYSFRNPFTGEPLSSDLLYPATFSMKVENEGATQVVAEGEQLELSSGDATIVATAVVHGGVRSFQQYDAVQVAPPLGSLIVDASGVPSSAQIRDLSQASGKVVVSKKDGEAFAQDEWDHLVLTAENEAGVPWDVVKAGEPGVFEVVPSYVDGDAWVTSEKVFGAFPLTPASIDTVFTARVESESNPYLGETAKPVEFVPDLVGTALHWLWLIVLLLVLLWLAIMELRKPRLPKLAPSIEIEGETYRFAYNGKVSHRVMPPWSPESTFFSAQHIRGFDDSAFELYSRYQLGKVGLRATRGKGRRRSFCIDDSTLSAMRGHEENPGSFPAPEYTCLTANRFSKGSSFRFNGLARGRAGRVREEEYVIRF